jgi:hypothetical protein
MQALMERAGTSAIEEILAIAPELHGGLAGAAAVISALRSSRTTVDLK